MAAGRDVLRRVAAARERGDPTVGDLDLAAGFLPAAPPRLALARSHAAWDELAAALPELVATRNLRRSVDDLPRLRADADALADRDLPRAACLLAIVAHAVVRLGPDGGTSLPAVLRDPWTEVCRRLGRPGRVLTYADLITTNWRPADPSPAGTSPAGPSPAGTSPAGPSPAGTSPAGRSVPTSARRVETMRLLVPTVDSPEERVFYLTQTEILARTAPLVGAVLRAQEAASVHDGEVLVLELAAIADRLREVTAHALPKIDPVAGRPTSVDPVRWARTVAPLAVPVEEGLPGPSGTSSPLFHLLDAFLGRTEHASTLGRETIELRRTYPWSWRELVGAVAADPIGPHVHAAGDRLVRAAHAEVLAAYSGEDGFLGRHRRKVYGYLETAFKVGRDVTIGGFRGPFRERTWDEVDDELVRSRDERPAAATPSAPGWHRLPVLTARPVGDATHVVLDASGTGLRHRPGDRLAVRPDQDPTDVAAMLEVLGADGDEPVVLDALWAAEVARRAGSAATSAPSTTAPLRDVLTAARLGPVDAAAVRRLRVALAGRADPDPPVIARLRRAEAERQDLPSLLRGLRSLGVDLLHEPAAAPAEGPADERADASAEGPTGPCAPAGPAGACRLLLPETPRRYSIASGRGLDDPAGVARVELLVGHGDGEPAARGGVAVRHLASLAGAAPGSHHLAVRVEPGGGCCPPEDPRVPLVLVAGGTGIASFLAVLERRREQPDAAPCWLLVSVRTSRDLPRPDLLAAEVAAGRLRLDVACTREDVTLEVVDGRVVATPGPRRRIDQLVRRPEVADDLRHLLRPRPAGGTAEVRVCGGAGFAAAARRGLDHVLGRRDLRAEGRLRQEVHDHGAGAGPRRRFTWSEVSRHHDDLQGWWLVVDGRVHDVTCYLDAHPGGAAPLRAYAGRDATAAFRRVGHDRDQEPATALRERCIGVLHDPLTGAAGDLRAGPPGPWRTALSRWLELLDLVVAVHNSMRVEHAGGHVPSGRGDDGGAGAAHRLQLVLDTHRRLLRGALPDLLGAELEAAAAATVDALPASPGEVDDDGGDGAVARRLADDLVRRSRAVVDGAGVQALLATIDALDPPGDGAVAPPPAWEATRVLEREGLLLLDEVASAVADGLALLEVEGGPDGAAVTSALAVLARVPERVAGALARAQARAAPLVAACHSGVR